MDLLQNNVFSQTAAVLFVSAVLGALAFRLRQPLIVAFLATGILVGPSGLGVIESHEQLALLANIGIAMLLFVVGLRLDLHMIRTTGPVALATGIGQVLFTSIFGFLIALAMGFSIIGSAYVAVALTFSSTIIIVKLLSDKKEIDSLHGRIAVGFLIVQDLVAILAMIALTAFGGRLETGAPAAEIAWVFVKGLGFLGAIALLMRYVLPRLLKELARSQELLLLFAIAWAVTLAALGDALGFSKEVGAFLAGVSLASSGYRESIGARLVTLRDFLLLFFFIDLGVRLDMSALGAQVAPALLFSLFVLVGNPLIVMAIMGFMGYRRRTGFLAGLAVAQISEFSLILAALGLSLGHIDSETMGLITLVGLITICGSTYMILYSAQLYRLLSEHLRIFERKNPQRENLSEVAALPSVDVILLGLGNYGGGIAAELMGRNRRVVGVDFDPQALRRWQLRGLPTLYGDAGDPEFLEELPVNRARWIVCSARDRNLNLSLLALLKARHYQGRVALTAGDEQEAQHLERSGVHVVLRPFRDAAEQAADELTEAGEPLSMVAGWPVALRDIRLRPGSLMAGKAIKDVPVRSRTGAHILAISRAGTVHYDPGPDFPLFPGDRLTLVGEPDRLKQAAEILEQRELAEETREENGLAMAEIPLRTDSPLIGRSLADLRFRHDFGVTVIGIRRGEERLTSPGPSETLRSGDCLIVVGQRRAVDHLTSLSPM